MRLQIGYVPLLDAAALIAAVKLGFTAQEGLAVDLVPVPSWATLRDRLALGHLDGAHMLAPLAVASALGLSGLETPLIVPIALNLNGNAITVSMPVWEAMAVTDGSDAGTVARAFAGVARRRSGEGRPLVIGTVHPFSSHTYQLRRFAELGGLDLDEGVHLVVIPPPQIAEALQRRLIDGFCVGSPWNSVAAAAGYGRVAVLGSELIADCPEKVLALPASETEISLPLVRALRRAGLWCQEPGNRAQLAALLSARDVLGVDPTVLGHALAGTPISGADGAVRVDPRFIVFGEGAQRPDPAHALWCLDAMRRAGQVVPNPGAAEVAAAIYRPDLYDDALATGIA
ncbi:CmpA/NrtA family ABC transporter substrate-binding protein [Methylobacterium sp. Leaf466]|uniref:CmpA/NrtA family ABC transporter substrate-binding protein n=1 Tax=Methylobacterium sp. Leaf466 TaxID=1736386 RepID=UPI0006F7F67A|nr:CmpA/NrtA family ABC transporter substrate-binding protein [Methylobacterium sp. Leaf466]KQT77805.1 nitrate transporter [Methylobacterium sp. Leaf466]